jgi:TPR repeat protein/serine/threonine protein kinase
MAEWQVGDRIENQWEVKDIRLGGMGIVYIVFDHRWHRQLAIKTYPELSLQSKSEIDRFTREATTWIRLDPHPNVTQAISLLHLRDKGGHILGTPFGKAHLFLEYVSGGNLRGWMSSAPWQDRLPNALRFALQLCDGLSHIHSRGIIAHRDIKPENCLLTQDGDLKVTDFGLASIHELRARLSRVPPGLETGKPSEGPGALTHAGVGMGTPDYMPPEQFIDARSADVRSDIYSFGILLFEMLSGRIPFSGRNRGELAYAGEFAWQDWAYVHLNAQPRLEGQHIPSDLKTLLHVCLAKDPGDRYPNFEPIRSSIAGIYQRVAKRTAPQPARPQPQDQTLLGLKAAGLFELGLHEEALAYLDRVIAQDPSKAIAWASKANVYLSLQCFEEARRCAEQATSLDDRDYNCWMTRAAVLNAMNKREEALACVERAIALDSGSGDAWFTKADVLLSLDRLDAAKYCAERATSLDAGQWLWWKTKAEVLIKMERYEDALDSCAHALALNEGEASIWELHGGILSCLLMREARFVGDVPRLSEALKSLDTAIGLQPRSRVAYEMKAKILLFAGRYDDALVAIRRALDLTPDSAKQIEFAKLANDQGAGCERGWDTGRPDYSNAAQCYRLAAELCYPDGQFNLAQLYESGRGVEQSYAEAIRLYRLAAESGHAVAKHNLGVIYRDGRGTGQDYEEAVKWFREAANLGLRASQYEFGRMLFGGQGIEQRPSAAYVWLYLAALDGDLQAVAARDMVADFLVHDEYFTLDPSRGASTALAVAKHNLGVAYYHGQGIERDFREAAKWFTEAAEMGCRDSRLNLGLMYKNGQGVEEDFILGYYWLHLAALGGDAEAAEKRDLLATSMTEGQILTALTLVGRRQQ